jgi:hypothetical protein
MCLISGKPVINQISSQIESLLINIINHYLTPISLNIVNTRLTFPQQKVNQFPQLLLPNHLYFVTELQLLLITELILILFIILLIFHHRINSLLQIKELKVLLNILSHNILQLQSQIIYPTPLRIILLTIIPNKLYFIQSLLHHLILIIPQVLPHTPQIHWSTNNSRIVQQTQVYNKIL